MGNINMYRILLGLIITLSFSTAAMAQSGDVQSGFNLGASGSTATDSPSAPSVGASAQATSSTQAGNSVNADTGNSSNSPKGEYTYEGLLAIGHAKYVASDFTSAMQQYEQARLKDPARPEAYYFIGCAQKAQGRYQEAVQNLASAATVAGEDDAAMNARALFVIAVVWETARNFDKAKYAWIQYKAFARLHADANPFIDVADAHIAAIDALAQRNAGDKKVIERIEASKE